MSVRQWNGTLYSYSGNGWLKKVVEGETPREKLIRVPFMAIFFLTNVIILSALGHKEMRFITNVILIGQIA